MYVQLFTKNALLLSANHILSESCRITEQLYTPCPISSHVKVVGCGDGGAINVFIARKYPRRDIARGIKQCCLRRVHVKAECARRIPVWNFCSRSYVEIKCSDGFVKRRKFIRTGRRTGRDGKGYSQILLDAVSTARLNNLVVDIQQHAVM